MAKCRDFVCDVCWKHLPSPKDDGALFIRSKRRWYSWHESGSIRHRLCVCGDCQEKIMAMVQQEG